MSGPDPLFESKAPAHEPKNETWPELIFCGLLLRKTSWGHTDCAVGLDISLAGGADCGRYWIKGFIKQACTPALSWSQGLP